MARYLLSWCIHLQPTGLLIPAVYGTLSKTWIANIDSSLVSTTDAYTYFLCVIEVLNEGLPRAAWSTIGNGDTTRDTAEELLHRLSLTYTLISVQSLLGFLLSVVFLFAAPGFVGAFVPGEVRATSVKYLRILTFDSLASTLNTAVSLGTRALDKPDVPLLMSSVQTLIQIFLELALVSTVQVKGFTPTTHTRATIKLICDRSTLLSLPYTQGHSPYGHEESEMVLLYILSRARVARKMDFYRERDQKCDIFMAIHGVVGMGQAYATARGVFNTIRWGLIMVPVNALEATSNAFVGHRWGIYQSSKITSPSATSWSDIRFITAPSLRSVLIVLPIECPMCIALSIRGARLFARCLSNSDEVAQITAVMWKSIDWCYICYGVSTQLATVLLAIQTRWYLYQPLISNIFYALPWAIALPRVGITPDTAWTYHKWVLYGSSIFYLTPNS
ncbi:hypothetical protein M422DRAFT_40995 [Sphaerobolus stellatus SS14]|nr:hypothetical protein M422DRAFT_40995 [Sphaerobolus stellatus SS14]